LCIFNMSKRTKLSAKRKRQLKMELFEKQDGRCHYCNTEMHLKKQETAVRKGMLDTMATLDHIQPVLEGGILYDNSVLACHKCNNARAHMDYEQFKSIRKSPYWELHTKKFRQDYNYKCNLLNHIKRFRPFVYI